MRDAIVWTAEMENLQRHQKCLPATAKSWSLSNRTDCRPEFLLAARQALSLATEGRVFLDAPFMNVDKTYIAKLAHTLGVPLEKTWSCYKGGEVHCGQCGTCTERIEAIWNAGFRDPTTYTTGKYAATLKLLKEAGKLRR